MGKKTNRRPDDVLICSHFTTPKSITPRFLIPHCAKYTEKRRSNETDSRDSNTNNHSFDS